MGGHLEQHGELLTFWEGATMAYGAVAAFIMEQTWRYMEEEDINYVL